MMSTSDYDKFIDSIEDGKLDNVKLYFRTEFLEKIIKSSDDSSRPIHIASKNGNVEIVEYLLNEGSDVEVETTNGKRALHFAAMEGHADIVKLLIAHCSDMESETTNGERPIHYASMKGHVEVLKTLIDNNCRLEPRNRDGNTPLALAATCENEECMSLLATAIECRKTKKLTNPSKDKDMLPLNELIKHNFISTIMDPDDGKTLLDLVLERNDKVLLEMIKMKPVGKHECHDLLAIKGKGINDKSYKILEECILYRALRHGNPYTFYILSTPDIVNRPTLFMGPTVLEMTVEFKIKSCTELVIKNLMKADESWEKAKEIANKNDNQEVHHLITSRQGYLMRREKVGFSRLHVAVFDRAPDMVRYIVQNQLLPIDIGHKSSGTPLSLSYALFYAQCMEILEEYNASANTYDRYKQTPLHIAIASGLYDLCDYVLERMTDLEVKDAYNFTVLDRARKADYKDLCDKLIAKGAKYNDDPRISDGEEYPLPMF